MIYRVFGNTTVVVTVEVSARNEEEAYEKAAEQLSSLRSYAGNGGYDKLVGVSGDKQSVNIDEDIEYDDIELLVDEGDSDEEDDDDE